MNQISKELQNENVMRRHCEDVVKLVQDRELEILGPKHEINHDSDYSNSTTDLESSEDIMSMSDF